MKFFLTVIFMVLILLLSNSVYSQNKVLPDDLDIISGPWDGTLTYLDYSTDKRFTMPANVLVERGKNENQAHLLISYPKEPNANSKDKITLSRDGNLLNKNKVVSRKILSNQEVHITTEYSGKDNRKKALIRNIYIFGPKRFIIRKEVKINGSADWLLRNEYTFSR